MILTVSPDGSAEFTTIQAAVDAAPNDTAVPTVIRVLRGDYREKLHVNKDNLRIIGDAAERVTLTYGDYAKQLDENGNEKTTFLSYTMIITGNNVELQNMTICNDAGAGDVVGQAVALYAAGDRITVRDCRLIARQDTLYCGPTMANVVNNAKPNIIPMQSQGIAQGGFTACRQYYENCVIEGDVDFIFGPYTSYFESCKLICLDRGKDDINGYYTAANTPLNQRHGFVFHRCHLTTDTCADETVYLGRPWRAYGKTAFIDCVIDPCVKREGWEDWDLERPVTWHYQEYGDYDMSHRHPAAQILSKEEADSLNVDAVLSGYDSWHPQKPMRTIYICGDSTAADYHSDQAPMTGWGQALPALLHGNVHVQNEAQCGRSSKSFIAESRLLNIEHCLKPNDIMLIQFGHNDEKPDRERATDPYTTYQDYLTLYINAARDHGAIPVLLTPIVRRRFENGVLTPTHGDYPEAMRKLAKQKGVALIDMEKLTQKMVSQLGEEASVPLWCHITKGHRNYPEGATDDTHLTYQGAYRIASIVANALNDLI